MKTLDDCEDSFFFSRSAKDLDKYPELRKMDEEDEKTGEIESLETIENPYSAKYYPK